MIHNAGSITIAYRQMREGDQDELRRIGERTDVFALGVILCELLTGQRPWPFKRNAADSPAEFQNKLRAYLHLIETRPPTSPNTLSSKVTASVEDICLQALRVDANQRFNSCARFAEKLREAVASVAGATSTRPATQMWAFLQHGNPNNQ